MIDRLRAALDAVAGNLSALAQLTRSGVVRPVRPSRLALMAVGAARYGLTLTAGYAAGAARHPDRPAIVDDLGTLRYAEVAERTDRLARALATGGLDAGSRLGILCRNHRWAVEAQVAAGKLGADVVLLNPGLSAAQLTDVAAELQVRTLVADPEFDEVLGAVSCPRIRTGPPIEALIEQSGAGALPLRPPAGHTIVLTSGTTGTPKGARRPAPRSMAPAGAILSAIPLRAASRCSSPRR